jgi:hypothetical protein
MFHAAKFLALNTYDLGKAVEVRDGDWSANCLDPDGATCLFVIVRHKGHIAATAQMDATAKDGVRNIEVDSKATIRRRKAMNLMSAWVRQNAASVYPHPLGAVVPSL